MQKPRKIDLKEHARISDETKLDDIHLSVRARTTIKNLTRFGEPEIETIRHLRELKDIEYRFRTSPNCGQKTKNELLSLLSDEPEARLKQLRDLRHKILQIRSKHMKAAEVEAAPLIKELNELEGRIAKSFKPLSAAVPDNLLLQDSPQRRRASGP